MSAFQSYLKAVNSSSAPKRKGLEPEVHAEAVKAWKRMRDGWTSPIENVYLHESTSNGMTAERKIFVVFERMAAVSVDHTLPALHYLETLSDLGVLHIDHVSLLDRVLLKLAAREKGMALNLRNQTSNCITAFNEIREQIRSLDAVEVDLLSRHEKTDQVHRAERVLDYFTVGDRAVAQREAKTICDEILKADFDATLLNSEASN